ncbi:TPA: hypothetical protein I8H22_002602 [Salmonella enterica subsp. enterica serovar Anatum]|nr:hypothetical protein [Salmonella enterica subsp. enterica serovar Anatum]
MNRIEQILGVIGVSKSAINDMNQTDYVLILNIIESVQRYAMYKDKDYSLETECEKIIKEIKKERNKE